jgi:acetyltransferase-like isoleucine patch superfamily enzyme
MDRIARWKRLAATIYSGLYYPRTLRAFGRRSMIRKPILVRGGSMISIGSQTHLRNGARLDVFQRPGAETPCLSIGDHVLIEQNFHLVCSNSITIGDHVMIAAGCSIVDTTHPLPTDTDRNVGYSTVPGRGAVSIGAHTMLGVGVVVLPGVAIGERCVIGANSVVTSDIPDRTIAAGAPAKIIRRL